jgi:deoxyribose-phosphate aldolase
MNPTVAEPVETYESLASLVDYHLLAPTLSGSDVAEGCRIAREYRVRSVIVRPCDLPLVMQWMSGSGIVVASVAGYPDGTSTTATKLYEARDQLKHGAREIEFVLNPALTISRSFQHVETELMQIAKSCNESGARLTVIFNSRWLDEDHKIIVTKICRRVEAHRLSIDADEPVFKPLLKEVLTLKLGTPVATLEDALAAREAGFTSFAAMDPVSILDAWRTRITPPPQTSPAVS